jgi:glutamate formiminotransferase
MKQVLAVPNWSLYDSPRFKSIAQMGQVHGVKIHYSQGDIDHQRSVTGFSGEGEKVFSFFKMLCRELLPLIDLCQGKGVHPRSGALDVAPFVCLEGSEDDLIGQVRKLGHELHLELGLSGYFYEKASHPGRENRLPILRGQLGAHLSKFDFGEVSHPKWGYSVIGVRNFLLAANINLRDTTLSDVRTLARQIRELRETGDPGFAGVRALGFWLESRKCAQLSLNFTQPERTSFDFVYEWLDSQKYTVLETELIGVIHQNHLASATYLDIAADQVVF